MAGGRASEIGPGTQLNGMYEIDRRIAAGGMGEVYRGHNIQTGDPVAIKIVLPDFARDPTILALFRKEASVLNHLSHGAIVRYHVFSIDRDIDRPYLAMEFVDGISLAERMAAGPMPGGEARLMIARVASGLAAAHEAGVIHRDLSPDNIILPGGIVAKAKIIDFGIARSENTGGGTLLGGRFAGKYDFVAPEQLGLFGGEVSARSDIYSLGLVFAAALRGQSFDMGGTPVAVIEKRRQVPDLTDIEAELIPVIDAMLQPDPAARPDNMETIVEWLTPAPQWRGVIEGRNTLPPSTAGMRTVVSMPPGPFPPGPFAQEGSLPPTRGPGSHAPLGTAPPRGTVQPRDRPTRVAGADDASEQTQTGATNGDEEVYVYKPSNPTLFERPISQAQAQQGPDTKPKPRAGSPRTAIMAGTAVVVALVAIGAAAYALYDGTPDAPAPDKTADTSRPDAASTTPPPEEPKPPVRPPMPVATPAPPTPPAPPSAPISTATPPVVIDPVIPPPPPVETPQVIKVRGSAAITTWIEDYDIGPCAYVRPRGITGDSAAIEGLGQDSDPFDRLDRAFQRDVGFEPKITLKRITDRQCAVADLLQAWRKGTADVPDLDLGPTPRIASGQSLRGTIGKLGARPASLWLVDDRGMVYDLGAYLQRQGGSAEFSIKLVNLKKSGPLPQLVVAIAGEAGKLATSDKPQRVADFVAALGPPTGAGSKPIGIAAAYFTLDN